MRKRLLVANSPPILIEEPDIHSSTSSTLVAPTREPCLTAENRRRLPSISPRYVTETKYLQATVLFGTHGCY